MSSTSKPINRNKDNEHVDEILNEIDTRIMVRNK